MMEQLRSEILEAQKIRTQIIVLKITAIGAAFGYIVPKLGPNSLNSELLFIPAFAAIFFDLLVSSQSFSIKRAGFYIRKYLEPVLHESYKFNADFIMWEAYMTRREVKKNLSFYGNIGMTFLTCFAVMLFALISIKINTGIKIVFFALLVGLCILDWKLYEKPSTYADTLKLDPLSLKTADQTT